MILKLEVFQSLKEYKYFGLFLLTVMLVTSQVSMLKIPEKIRNNSCFETMKFSVGEKKRQRNVSAETLWKH